MKSQLFKLVREYPHSSLEPDKSRDQAFQAFRSEVAIKYREWPVCGQHHPIGLPEKCEYVVSSKQPKYVITLQCPECQKANQSQNSLPEYNKRNIFRF